MFFASLFQYVFTCGDGRADLLFRSSLLNDGDETMINSTDEDLFIMAKSLKPTNL